MKKDKFLLILIAVSFIYGCVFFALKYLQYKAFFSYEWDDDACYAQMAYNTLRGHFLQQTVFIAQCGYGRFTPFVVFLSFLYLFFPYLQTWFALTSFSYGFSSVVLYKIGRRLISDARLVFLISLAFLFYAPLHYANLGMIETKTLALLPLFLTFYFLITKRFLWYAVFLILSISTKQDVALTGLCFGAYLFIRKYPKKWWLSTVVFCAAYFLTANFLKNTVFYARGVDSHPEIHVYARFDIATFSSILAFALSQPLEFLKFVFSASHVRAVWLVFYPLLFLPLFSLEVYLALPMLLEIFLIKGVRNYNAEFFAAVIPFLFIGILYVFRDRVRGRKRAYILAWLILAFCLISNFSRNIIGDLPMETTVDQKNFVDKSLLGVDNIFDRRLYRVDAEDALAWRFISKIPRGASVTASGDLLTPLSMRTNLYEFALNEPQAWESEYLPSDDYPAYDSDYILIHTRNICNGLGGQYAFADSGLSQKIIEDKLLTKYNYGIAEQEGNFILLKKNVRQAD